MKIRPSHTLSRKCDLREITFDIDKYTKSVDYGDFKLLEFDAAKFITANALGPKPRWMISQAESILAPLCTEPSVEKTSQNLKDSISNPGVKLAYAVLGLANRSAFISDQVENLDICRAVPTFPGISKRIYGIPYSAWDFDFKTKNTWTICGRVMRDLLPYCGLHKEYHEMFGTEKLLEYRSVQPEGYKVTAVGDPSFDKLGAEFRRLLLRMWIYSSVDNPYVVNNLDNWENEPYLHLPVDKLNSQLRVKASRAKEEVVEEVSSGNVWDDL